MKVLHTIGGFGAKSGGTSTCTYDLLSAMQNNNDDCIEILTPSVTDSSDKLMGNGENWIHSVPNDYKTPVAYSPNLKNWLKNSDFDVYHTNGLWMHINHETCSVARRKGKPYLITPHGMLYPVALYRNYWKKWPLRELWFNKDIAHATCIHATCKQEMEYVRKFGYNGPIALIPNPVGIPDYVDEIIQSKSDSPKSEGKRIIGFLGRLHPRKNAEGLIKGLAHSAQKNVELWIMGKGDEEYEKFLKEEVTRLGLEKQVKFLGFVRGRDKYERLAEIDALFVPSDFENFGMIVTEALLMATPVMASLGTPWEELNTEKCGWWCDRTTEKIAEIINEVATLPVEDLKSMGERGHNLVITKYSDKKVASQMWQLYHWLNQSGSKPDFVFD